MEVDEVKIAKGILETDLNKLLKEFTQKTSLAINNIEVTSICEKGIIIKYQIKIKLDV